MARVLNSVHGVKETSLMTPLTIEEQQFVDAYIKLGVGADAVRAVYPEACAKSKAPEYATHRATALLNKPNIEAAILRRMEEMRDSRIADSKEVMEYFTQVMRGQIKDQFGLDAPLSERTKAAQEIAKRTIDIENRLAGNADAAVTIHLDWTRK